MTGQALPGIREQTSAYRLLPTISCRLPLEPRLLILCRMPGAFISRAFLWGRTMQRSGSRLLSPCPRSLSLILAALLVSLAGAAWAADPITEVEKWVGEQFAAALAAEYGIVDDPGLVAWVQAVGERLAAKAERQDVHYTFTILDSGEANAFTLPGGHIFVTFGLLQQVESEDELACVLAHEVGHVNKRHTVKEARDVVAEQWVVREAARRQSTEAYAGVSLAGQLAILRHVRRWERQADNEGLRIAYQAGYDPQGLVNFFEPLPPKRPSQLTQLFASHPAPQDRVQGAKESQYLRADDPAQLVERAGRHAARFDLASAMALYQQALALAPDYAPAKEAIASIRQATGQAEQGTTPQPQEPIPESTQQALDLLRHYHEQVAKNRAQTATEIDAARERLRRSSEDRTVGMLTDTLLLVSFDYTDVKWMALAAQAKLAADGLLNATYLASRSLTQAEAVFDQTLETAQVLDRALRTNPSLPAVQLVQDFIADSELAAAEAHAAAARCHDAADRVLESAGALTPVMFALLGLGRTDGATTTAQFATLETLAWRARSYAASAERNARGGNERAALAALRLAQWRLTGAHLCLSGQGADTLERMTAYWTRVSVTELHSLLAGGRTLGEAAMVSVMARSLNRTVSEVEALNPTHPHWVNLVSREGLRADALYVPIRFLLLETRASFS